MKARFWTSWLCAAAGLVLIGMALLAGPVAATEPKRVMLLHSFGRDFKPWSDYARAIRAELDQQSRWPLNIYEHSLEIARSSDENPEKPFVDYLRALFAAQRLDLIVSIGAPAAAFVQRHRQQLFPMTPMLFTVVDQRRVQFSKLTDNDVVVAVSINYRAAFENILQVLPNTKKVAVVTGNSPIENFWREEIGREVRHLADRVAFEWYNDLPFEDILQHAAKLPAQSAIFWELMIVDAAGVVHEEGRALARLYAVANAPIFSYTDAFFGREIVGGPHVPVLEHGRQVAEVAVRMLGGEKPGDIKVPPIGFATPKFDWREMQRWGISESRLPPGSEIHFRDPTVWEQYRPWILLILAALLLQAALIGWLIYEHRRRQLAEIQSRNSLAEMTHMNRLATAGELSASIAHEVNQPLTGIVTRANAAMRWLAAETPNVGKAREALSQIVAAGHRASEIVANIRLVFKRDTQQKSQVDINKLIWAVLGLAYIDLRRHEIVLESRLDERLPMVLGNHVQLQQVILNLIMNAIDAMSSTQPRILCVRSKAIDTDRVYVSIEDTGIGIGPSNLNKIFEPLFTTKEHGMGMGLSICRTIIEAHGGRLWASPGNGRGAIFQFELPINADDG
jgi:signal transduction histidine kinase/ABC-type uncharacterized transport system substrate-binding protein